MPHLLNQTPLPERTLFWRRGDTRAVRRGDWKLVVNRSEAPQLYDLRSDPSERDDRAGRETATVAGLRQAFAIWETEVAASAASVRMGRGKPGRTGVP